MTAPEDPNGLREALARALCIAEGTNPDGKVALIRLRWPYLNWQMKLETADALMAGPLASLIAERDAAVAKMKTFAEAYVVVAETAETEEARARAAEAELDEERQESARLALAVMEGQAEIARLRSALKFIAEPDHRQGMFLTGRSAQAIALRTLAPKEQP